MTRSESPLARPDYRALQKYLRDRYADVVVLTFGQIEDLIGAALPEAAYAQLGWWMDPNGDGSSPPQRQAWAEAKRAPSLNVSARTMSFERMPE